MTPPITITSGDGTITYQCGTAILWHDEPERADRVSLSLTGGEAIRRSELREWAVLLAHPAVQAVIAGEDIEPLPTPAIPPRFRLVTPPRDADSASPLTLLTYGIWATLSRQQQRLGLTTEHVGAIGLLIAQQVEREFGIAVNAVPSAPLPAAGAVGDPYQAGVRAGRRDVLLSLAREVDRWKATEER